MEIYDNFYEDLQNFMKPKHKLYYSIKTHQDMFFYFMRGLLLSMWQYKISLRYERTHVTTVLFGIRGIL
jgi:hypothetical protein